MIKKIFSLTMIRGVPSVGALCLTLVLPSLVDLDTAADFFSGIAWLYFLGIVSRCGVDYVFLKNNTLNFALGKRKISDVDVAMLFVSFFIPFLLIFVCLVANFSYFWGRYYWVVLSLPAFSCLGAVSFFLRASGEEYWGTVAEPGTALLFVALFIVIFNVLD